MQAALTVLGVAALGGATLAGIRLSGKPRPPTWLALGHGVIAATGLFLLIVRAAGPGLPSLAQVSLGMIILAAAGGSILFVGFHLREKPLPIPFVLGHGLLALTGVVLLLIAVLQAN